MIFSLLTVEGDEKVKISSRTLTVAVIIAIFVTSALLAVPMLSGAIEEGYPRPSRRRATAVHVHRRPPSPKAQLFRQFFRDATITTIEGSVATHFRNILIIEDVESNNLNILLPSVWRIGSKVMNVSEIFEEGYLSPGDNVTIKALQRIVTNRNDTSLIILVAYEISNDSSDYILHAVLPFNVVASND
ncbi:TPA: hypothetical protein EYP70_04720 [Candidatus Bathyarchaeota archaeon]|nr:hypothetical protein [Candidatus Bathyarchaeota archaeon]